jgi:uncharacterized membrane protein
MRPRDYILKQCIIVMLIAATFVTNANNINNAKITHFLKSSFCHTSEKRRTSTKEIQIKFVLLPGIYGHP